MRGIISFYNPSARHDGDFTLEYHFAKQRFLPGIGKTDSIAMTFGIGIGIGVKKEPSRADIQESEFE
jgi:hypothetical protein